MNSAVSPVQAIGQLAPEDGVAPLARLGGEPQESPVASVPWSAAGSRRSTAICSRRRSISSTLAVGNAENLHQIMIRLEESRLSFQLLMQVRGRLLEAYQDVMKMQI
jgi:flagellar hook-basal body complex protein FliE